MKRTVLSVRTTVAAILFISTLQLISCNQKNDSDVANSNDDTINYRNKDMNGEVNSLLTPADATNAEGRQLILTQIDSTCRAISLLDSAKQELTDMSPSAMSLIERNRKSKVIFNINLLQNELIREMDASILSSLKAHTNELNNINIELEKNAAHLSAMVQQINKVTACISRLTNILSDGLSRGFIKPLTPKGVAAETIKSSL